MHQKLEQLEVNYFREGQFVGTIHIPYYPSLIDRGSSVACVAWDMWRALSANRADVRFGEHNDDHRIVIQCDSRRKLTDCIDEHAHQIASDFFGNNDR